MSDIERIEWIDRMWSALKCLALASLIVPTLACQRTGALESGAALTQAAATVDVTGVFDFTIDVLGDTVRGVATVSREGEAYSVSMTTEVGRGGLASTAVPTSNVRREGNTLIMDAATPGGEGVIEMRWRSRNEVDGIVFIEDRAMNLQATRREPDR